MGKGPVKFKIEDLYEVESLRRGNEHVGISLVHSQRIDNIDQRTITYEVIIGFKGRLYRWWQEESRTEGGFCEQSELDEVECYEVCAHQKMMTVY